MASHTISKPPMTPPPSNNLLEQAWAQLGILFGCGPSGESPDLERLLLDTARRCPENFRLVPVTVTWLAEYGHFVARHRLKRLVRDELEADAKAALGLLIEEAVGHGATRDLLIVSEVCTPRAHPGPLAAVHRSNPALAAIAQRRASKLSRRWGVWTPPVELKPEATGPSPGCSSTTRTTGAASSARATCA